MEIHITAEQQTELESLAASQGLAPAELASQMIARSLDHERWFKRQVQIGLDQIERGEYLTHEQVGKRIKGLSQS